MSGNKKHRIMTQTHLLVGVSVGLATILTILAFLGIRSGRNNQIRVDFTRKAQTMTATLQDTLNSFSMCCTLSRACMIPVKTLNAGSFELLFTV